MTDPIEGGCRCGRVRFRVALAKPPRVYACHCRDCQTWSGSAFSTQFIVPEDQLTITGEPALFELTSSDGERTSRQRGCPICFTRVYNTNTRPARNSAVVRAGTLDRSDDLRSSPTSGSGENWMGSTSRPASRHGRKPRRRPSSSRPLQASRDGVDPDGFAGRYGDYLQAKVGAVFPGLKSAVSG